MWFSYILLSQKCNFLKYCSQFKSGCTFTNCRWWTGESGHRWGKIRFYKKCKHVSSTNIYLDVNMCNNCVGDFKYSMQWGLTAIDHNIYLFLRWLNWTPKFFHFATRRHRMMAGLSFHSPNVRLRSNLTCEPPPLSSRQRAMRSLFRTSKPTFKRVRLN